MGVRVQRNRLERGAERGAAADGLPECRSQLVERIGRPVGQLSIAGGALGAHARRGAARASAHHGLGLLVSVLYGILYRNCTRVEL